MIPAGLAMMGGCFAQDSGRAVDTYWGAEYVKMGWNSAASVFSLDLPMSDSQGDYFHFKVSFDFLKVQEFKTWRIFLGCHSTTLGNSTWANDGCWLRSGGTRDQLSITFGKNSWNYPIAAGTVDIVAHDFIARVSLNGVPQPHVGTPQYQVAGSRSFRLYGDYTQNFFFAMYANKQSADLIMLYPMRSPGGAQAVWEFAQQTLVEI